MKARKARLDHLLVERGLVESREKGQALVMAGQVLVDGRPQAKPGHAVPVDARIELAGGLKYVSRGGLKLEAALDGFGIDVRGKVCLDAGASTGGFTDCLLQRGAAKVYAVDVGHGQLDWRLRRDPRVVVREGLNVRYLAASDLGEPADLVTGDLSFISLTLVLPALAAVLRPGGEMVLLVKPQFEAGRGEVGRGGIVRDPAQHEAACAKVVRAAEALGFGCALLPSPILGAEGNREFLLHARQQDGRPDHKTE
jgi:23S rRNA (cytidine1920-2'-O)/16S rRNA (cytidine1409-2'-O)-methyltransferase